MPTDKRKMDKLRKGLREELAIIEGKCKDGNATKEDYQQLTKLQRKLK